MPLHSEGERAARAFAPAPGYSPARVTARRGLLLIAAVLLQGCAAQRQLVPTPALYAAGIEQPFAATLPQRLRGAEVEIVYATDREPAPRPDGRLDYGIGRSRSLAVGSALVGIGGDATWEQLAEDARSAVRDHPLALEVSRVTEFERSPEFPLPFELVGGLPVVEAPAQRELDEVREAMQRALAERLAGSPRKEVLLYVHGVANSFDEALLTTAELWHYMGREFVPVAFTWPAGRGGVLRGYTYDRESSEFAVFHFKGFLDWLSRVAEVEAIHIVAHSRGTDVVSTGIRELLIDARARGEPPRARFKIRNLVLAAPDINLEIAMMRTSTEFVSAAIERLTIYTSPHDEAIGIAEFLFGGGLRLGRADYHSTRHALTVRAGRPMPGIAVVEYVGERGGAFGHDYFRTNPAVASDLVLTVRFGRSPGAENGRPLRHQKGIFWQIDDDYPAPPP